MPQKKTSRSDVTIMIAQGVEHTALENRHGYRVALPCCGKAIEKTTRKDPARQRVLPDKS